MSDSSQQNRFVALPPQAEIQPLGIEDEDRAPPDPGFFARLMASAFGELLTGCCHS